MESQPLDAPEVAGYLEVLGLRAERPSVGALRRLARVHLIRVPFETVSKLCYRERLGLDDVSPLELYLDGIRRPGFGGTCFGCLFG